MHGRQLGYHRVRLSDHPPSRREALFDTAGYVASYAGNLVLPGRNAPASEVDLLVDLGVFIHTQILGPEIAGALAGTAQRTLLVRLPRPADPASAALIGDLARVPWELARAAPRDPPLTECNLVLRLLLEGSLPAAGMAPLALGPGEDLRILLVFAEAPGRRPLAMRREREDLLALLRDEIQPRGRVRVDVLCHGVDCEALRRQVKEAHGYHLLHWSGHGLRNLLEVQGADGGRAHLSGEQLVALLREAGGFYPRLVYLSACHSGAMGRPRSWSELRAGSGLAASQVSGSGLTDTALALLGAGVAQVVAMRWVVGDDYARRLARRFYGYLLRTAAYSADSALNQARKDLLQHPKVAQMAAVDHANPLILGAERLQVRPPPGRSAQLARRVPRPQPLLPGGRGDLDPRSDFVGRGEPLTRLNREWLAHDSKRAVALVQRLRSLAEQVPEGWPRWWLRLYIADGLRMAGRADEALSFYAQAAAAAESAGHWADLGVISHNWANALRNLGQLGAAKVQCRVSSEAKRMASSPQIDVVMSDLESLRVDVMQGEARAAWPGIERLLGQVRGWWQRSRAGEPVPAAPDPESLGRYMASALDIARQAARHLKDWEGSLALLDEMESVEKDLGFGEHERARAASTATVHCCGSAG